MDDADLFNSVEDVAMCTLVRVVGWIGLVCKRNGDRKEHVGVSSSRVASITFLVIRGDWYIILYSLYFLNLHVFLLTVNVLELILRALLSERRDRE